MCVCIYNIKYNIKEWLRSVTEEACLSFHSLYPLSLACVSNSFDIRDDICQIKLNSQFFLNHKYH